MLVTLLAVIVVLGVLILVHELGHYWAAKAVDIKVIRFSIGLGPKAFGFRRGETEYVISWLPLGGYVRMAGMEGEEALEGLEGEGPDPEAEGEGEDGDDSDRDFASKPLWARTVTISAGVIMNILFAVLAFALVAFAWGVAPTPDARIGEVAEETLPAGTEALLEAPRDVRIQALNDRRVDDWRDLTMALAIASQGEATLHFEDGTSLAFTLPPADRERERLLESLTPAVRWDPVIAGVVDDGPAAQAGMRPGDRVVEVDGRPIEIWQELVAAIQTRPDESVPLVVERDGARRELVVVPEARQVPGEDEGVVEGRIGVAVDTGLERRGVVGALAYGVSETWMLTVLIVEFVGQLVTGGVDAAESIAGPIQIAEMSGEMAQAGAEAFLRFMAFISINLAILNLLPIPVLDGGHLVFLAIEAVRGKKVSPETRIRWTQVGLLVVAAIMVWAIGNDLLRVFGD